MQGVCHLLTHLGIYCKEALSSSRPYESLQFDDSSNDREGLLEYENMDLEDFVYEKVTEEIEVRKRANEMVPFHNHAPKALTGLVEGTNTVPQFSNSSAKITVIVVADISTSYYHFLS